MSNVTHRLHVAVMWAGVAMGVALAAVDESVLRCQAASLDYQRFNRTTFFRLGAIAHCKEAVDAALPSCQHIAARLCSGEAFSSVAMPGVEDVLTACGNGSLTVQPADSTHACVLQAANVSCSPWLAQSVAPTVTGCPSGASSEAPPAWVPATTTCQESAACVGRTATRLGANASCVDDGFWCQALCQHRRCGFPCSTLVEGRCPGGGSPNLTLAFSNSTDVCCSSVGCDRWLNGTTEEAQPSRKLLVDVDNNFLQDFPSLSRLLVESTDLYPEEEGAPLGCPASQRVPEYFMPLAIPTSSDPASACCRHTCADIASACPSNQSIPPDLTHAIVVTSDVEQCCRITCGSWGACADGAPVIALLQNVVLNSVEEGQQRCCPSTCGTSWSGACPSHQRKASNDTLLDPNATDPIAVCCESITCGDTDVQCPNGWALRASHILLPSEPTADQCCTRSCRAILDDVGSASACTTIKSGEVALSDLAGDDTPTETEALAACCDEAGGFLEQFGVALAAVAGSASLLALIGVYLRQSQQQGRRPVGEEEVEMQRADLQREPTRKVDSTSGTRASIPVRRVSGKNLPRRLPSGTQVRIPEAKPYHAVIGNKA